MPVDAARPARRRRSAAGSACDRRDRRRHNLFAYPAQSNFSRRAAPARLDRASAGARLGRAARRGGLRAHQPARPEPLEARLCRRSRSTRCSATPPASAACWPAATRWPAAPAVVRRRHDHRRLGAGRLVLLPGSGERLRGRHPQLPGAAGGRDRAAPPRGDRHRADPRARHAAWPAGCSTSCSRCATATASPWSSSTARATRRGAAGRWP